MIRSNDPRRSRDPLVLSPLCSSSIRTGQSSTHSHREFGSTRCFVPPFSWSHPCSKVATISRHPSAWVSATFARPAAERCSCLAGASV